jgi:hypothetical protein
MLSSYLNKLSYVELDMHLEKESVDLWKENLSEDTHLEDRGVGRIILKWS